jgi:hypothetical protein
LALEWVVMAQIIFEEERSGNTQNKKREEYAVEIEKCKNKLLPHYALP